MKKIAGVVLLTWAACACQDRQGEPRDTARGTILVEETELCPTCRIVMRELATLGQSSDPVSISEDATFRPCVVGRLVAGGYVMSAPSGGTELLYYDSTGQFLRRVGRRGGGPGEFGSFLLVAVGPADTLYVADPMNTRLTILSPADSVIGTIRVAGRVDAVATLPGGNILLDHYPKPSGGPRDLFEVVTPDGTTVRSFGQYSGPESPWGDQWIVSPAPNGGAWSGKMDRFEASQWSQNGELVRTLVWNLDWFPPNAPLDPGFPAEAAAPSALVQVVQFAADTLWVFVTVPDAHWTPGERRNAVNPGTTQTIFDTYVEVVDLTRAQAIARARFDPWLSSACNAQRLAYTAFYAPDGDTRLRVYEPILEK